MIDYEKYKTDGELPLWAVYFQKVEKILEPALEYDNTHNMQDVADCLNSCTMQLWTGENIAVVTQVQIFHRMRILDIFLAAGTLQELATLTNRFPKFE